MTQGNVLDPRAGGARRFEGKVAVVTGSGQGIGAATARRLAQEGASVVIADLNEVGAQSVCEELRDFGANAIIKIGDLSKYENAASLMERAKEEYGKIDVLCNIAGGNIWYQSFWLYEPDQIEAEVGKNFWTSVWCTRAVLPYMIEQRSGAIVNVASHSVVGKFRVPYAASKGGNIALATSVAREVAEFGIRVNCVAPSGTSVQDRVTPGTFGIEIPGTDLPPEEIEAQEKYRTQIRPMEVPMGRSGTPDEQAAAFAFLASDDASYITGQVLPVGGGQPYPF